MNKKKNKKKKNQKEPKGQLGKKKKQLEKK